MTFFTRAAVIMITLHTGMVTSFSLADERLHPANTYAVIVGVLSWEQGSLTTYPADDRQDVVLHQTLLSMGVPSENMTLLLDDAATRDAIKAAVTDVANKADEDSTLIIYYAGHGMKHGGEGIFACYDIRTTEMTQSGWRHHDLAESIRENFGGDNVLFFADCCFSGTLADVAKNLGESGIRAASLTSASRFNTSTNNWTFTLSLVEALSGKAIADTNQDGAVTLAEAGAQVREAMTYFEKQRSGYAVHQLPGDFKLAQVGNRNEGAARSERLKPLGFELGQYVTTKKRSARVVDARVSNDDKQELLVQCQAYSERPLSWIRASDIAQAEKPKLGPEPREQLPAAEAKEKASLDGKLTNLLAQFESESDFEYYGAYRDYGNWTGTSYQGHVGLPPGYWVYVFPNWYIWETPNQIPAQVVNQIDGDLKVLGGLDLPVVPNNQVPAFDPRQMTGEPDTPHAGDAATCWAAETSDGQRAWIELDYKNKLAPTAVHVYENCGPGVVYQVSGVMDGKESLLWKGVDPTSRHATKGISKIPIDTDKVFNRIRVYVNCKAVSGWNEIDAVGLVDTEGKTHWAVDARASSVYNQNVNIVFVDQFWKEEDRIAEQVADLHMKIQQHKFRIREMAEAMERERDVVKQLYQQLDEIKRP